MRLGAFGAQLAIECEDQELVVRLAEALAAKTPLQRTTRTTGQPDVTLVIDRFEHLWRARALVGHDEPSEILTVTPALLIDEVVASSHHLVARFSRGVTMVHAGVVAIGETAVVLPASSNAGKSTLVRALVRAGATYCSDEVAVITPAGHVVPYVKPISIRGPHATRRLDEPAHVGAVADPNSRFERTLLLVTFYRRGARWAPRRLGHGEAYLALVANSFNAIDRPDDTLSGIAALLGRGEAWGTPRGGAATAARRVADLVDRMVEGDRIAPVPLPNGR
jgi:hypothetical protein